MHLVILLYAMFASVFTVSKTALQYTEPLFFIGTRMVCAGVILLCYQYFKNKNEFKIEKKHFWRFFQLAACNIYLTNMFEFYGLQYLTSFKTCFIYSLSPFLSALFSYMLFAEKITPKKWIGFTVGFLGLLPILINESSSSAVGEAGHLSFISWPEIAVMLAATTSVYGWILLRQLVSENGYSFMMANGVSMLIGGSMALGHSYMTETWNPVPVTEALPFLECALLLVIISNLVCYNLYGYLLKTYTATFMSFAGFTTPFFTALFGWIYLGEVVTLPFYTSAAIVFSGLAIFYQEELKQGYLQTA